MIRALLVDDSTAFRALLRLQLESAGDVKVVGEAGSVTEGVRLVQALRPDLVTMDLVMPGGTGLDAVASIMAIAPLPIIVLTGTVGSRDHAHLLDATRAGAVTLETKPALDDERGWSHLRQVVHAMAGVRVFGTHRSQEARVSLRARNGNPPRLLAVGASTGGPPALDFLLRNLPANLRISILVAQHMGNGFMTGLVHWLSRASKLPVVVAETPIALASPAVIFPRDGHHLVVRGGHAHSEPALANQIAPSVDRLFESVAHEAPGNAMGLLLTGMGSDGAWGLHCMRLAGCLTVIQDEASSVIWGMPGAALHLDSLHAILPLDGIPPMIRELLDVP